MSQHFRCCCNCKSFTSADYINATKVADYASPPGADIAPYARPSGFVWTHTPDCAEVTDTDCGVAGNPLCGPWPIADRPTSCGDLLRNQNCYTASGSTAVVSCVDGHKVVQAEKQWHGRLGFETCPADCDEISVRYLVMSGEWAVVADFASDGLDYNASFSATTTVGRLDGIAVQSGCTFTNNKSVDVPTDIGELTIKWLSLIRYQCGTWSGVFTPAGGGSGDDWSAQSNAYNTQVALQECGDAGGTVPFLASNGITVTTYSVSNTHVEFVAVQNYGGADTITTSGTVDLSSPYYGTEAQRIAAGGTHSVEADIRALPGEWLLTNDAQLPWRTDGYRGLGVKIHYSEAGAKSPEVWSTYFVDLDGVDCAYTDPDADNYDGSVIGSPFDAGAGTNRCDKTFAWEHPTYECCSDAGACGTAGCWSVMFYGAFSAANVTGIDFTDALMPGTASDWTDNYTAGRLRPGSWWEWNTNATQLSLQKQCEGKVDFASFNLFGPCGAFRHQMHPDPDATTPTVMAACITGYTGAAEFAEGDVITAGTYAWDDKGLTDVDDAVVIYGGSNSGRVFQVAAHDNAGNITLGPEVLNQRNVLDAFDDTILFGWTSNTWADVDPGANGMIGKRRRWFRGAAEFTPPAICGKIKIVTTVADDAPHAADRTRITLQDAADYLQIDDMVWFVAGDSGDSESGTNGKNAGAGWPILYATDATFNPVSTPDGKHFIIDGAFDAASMTGYLKSKDAPAAKWNTRASRNNLVWQAWAEDATTGDFNPVPTNTDDRAATRKVLGSTPDGDTDYQWLTEVYGTTGHPFPSCPTPTVCGGKALVIPIQLCTDPLWLAPITCGDAIHVCAPEVEAMTTSRMAEYEADGAPALPGGCSFNIPTTPPLAGGLDCATNGPKPHSGQLAPWIRCVI